MKNSYICLTDKKEGSTCKCEGFKKLIDISFYGLKMVKIIKWVHDNMEWFEGLLPAAFEMVMKLFS